MGVRIERVELVNTGPVREFREDFSPLTVVYAPNERGKTTLVENMASSLFRRQETRELRLRDGEFTGAAELRLRLGDGSLKRFKPNSKTKLEDLLEKRRPDSDEPSDAIELPAGFMRLLVVRGAETGLDEPNGGLSARRLKDLISPQQLYDRIRANFGAGFVNYTRIEAGEISGDRKGRNKEYQSARERHDELRRAAEQFYQSVSQPERIVARKSLERHRAERERLERAKCHRAFRLARRREEIERRYTAAHADRVQRLRERIRDYHRQRSAHERLQRERQESPDHRERATWLNAARERYTVAQAQARNTLQQVALIVAATLGVAAALFYFIPGPAGTGGAPAIPLFEIAALVAVIAIVTALVVTLFMQRSTTPQAARAELERLGREFGQRFGAKLKGLADLDARRDAESRMIGRQEAQEQNIRSLEQELAELEREVRELLNGFGSDGGADGVATDWEQTVSSLEKDVHKAQTELSDIREELSRLNVDPSDYLEQDPGTTYSRRREGELDNEIRRLEQEISEQAQGYEEIRRQLALFLPSEVLWNGNPEQVVGAIEEALANSAAERDQAYYDIRAAHVVEGVLETFRRREDERLSETLNESAALGLIREFTGRYDRIEVVGDRVRIGTDAESYDFADLSTGAREQILLALRMGISRRLAGEESLFLLLDDAFQYSDWQRRELLVERAVEIVQQDWQVVYFTMDDDIRDRFVRRAADLGPGQFRLIEL